VVFGGLSAVAGATLPRKVFVLFYTIHKALASNKKPH